MSVHLIKQYLGDKQITFFDVGAKGGISDLLKLAPVTNAFGFEPNPAEHKALLSRSHAFAEGNFFNQALSDETGESDFRIAHRASYSSLLSFDEDTARTHLGRMPDFEKWKRDFSEADTIIVPTITLDEFCHEHAIKTIDFLKIDTQGSELLVLRGGKKVLEQTGVIKCEVSFIPVYKGQPSFADIDHFLRHHNFSFVDCIFYPESIRHQKNRNKGKVADRLRVASGGDVVYMKDPGSLQQENKFKTAIVLSTLGYQSEAASLLESAGIPEGHAEPIMQFLSSASFPQTMKVFVRSWCPPILLQWFKSLRG